MSDTPFIRKGEQVIVDGKLICTVKRDIQSGEKFSVADFQWFITPPVAGQAADTTPGFRTTNGGPDIFLNGEWLSDRVIAANMRKAADIAMEAGDDYIAKMMAEIVGDHVTPEASGRVLTLYDNPKPLEPKTYKRIDKIAKY